MRHRLSRTVVIGVSALALCGVGAGVALASSPADVPAAVSGVAGAKHHGGHGERGEHGEFTGAGQAHRTVDYQRGTVTAVAGGSITVRSGDGFTQTYTTGSSTKVRRDRQASTTGAVQTGDRVFVVASKEPNGLQALRVRDRGPAPAPASTPAPSTPTTPN